MGSVAYNSSATTQQRYYKRYNAAGVTYAPSCPPSINILPCVISTSGRIHGEFLRFLYILAHRRTLSWFERLGPHDPSDEAFKFRRGQCFWHTRVIKVIITRAVGHATALAVARRARVAEHTLRRASAGPHTQHDPLYQPTAPVAI